MAFDGAAGACAAGMAFDGAAGGCAAGYDFPGACAAGRAFPAACANAVDTIPKPNTVAAVVPIKRLNVIDAYSTENFGSLQPSNRDHPDACDLEWFVPVYKITDCELWEL